MLQEGTAEFLDGWAKTLYGYLTEPLFSLGQASFSTATLLKLLVYFVMLAWLARFLRRLLARRIFPRLRLDAGLAYSLSEIAFYVLITLGTLIALQTSGVDLSTITVLFGALGVGIGFGLQTIASNFISGLILLVERPIQVGDRIQVGQLFGRVTRIQMRATEILTNDNIAVIVPNNELIAQQVVNWSRGGDTIRIRVPIGVAYGSDIDRVCEALLEAARSVPAILRDPAPSIRLTGFGDSSIDFELLGWTRDLLHRRGEFVSRVNFAIHEALKKYGIEIPFPQRDLHLRSAVPLSTARVSGKDQEGTAPSGSASR